MLNTGISLCVDRSGLNLTCFVLLTVARDLAEMRVFYCFVFCYVHVGVSVYFINVYSEKICVCRFKSSNYLITSSQRMPNLIHPIRHLRIMNNDLRLPQKLCCGGQTGKKLAFVCSIFWKTV